MSDIDKILEDVERLAPGHGLLQEKKRFKSFDPCDADRQLFELGREYIDLCVDSAPALASEVRRLRADLANMRDQLVKAADKITFQRRKLVEAAIEIARDYQRTGSAECVCISIANRITGIRLRFEDGRFVEEK